MSADMHHTIEDLHRIINELELKWVQIETIILSYSVRMIRYASGAGMYNRIMIAARRHMERISGSKRKRVRLEQREDKEQTAWK